MTAPTERLIVENLARTLAAQGYEILQEPRGDLVPEFLGAYHPDLVALKEGKPSLVFEVRRRDQSKAPPLSEIRKLFEGQHDWKFNVIWAEAVDNKSIDRMTVDAIIQRFEEAVDLADSKFYGPALIASWSTLEAIARAHFPDELAKPQLPRSVIQALEGEGLIESDQAARLRSLVDLRNSYVHGAPDVRITKKDCTDFFNIVRHLVRDVTMVLAGRDPSEV